MISRDKYKNMALWLAEKHRLWPLWFLQEAIIAYRAEICKEIYLRVFVIEFPFLFATVWGW